MIVYTQKCLVLLVCSWFFDSLHIIQPISVRTLQTIRCCLVLDSMTMTLYSLALTVSCFIMVSATIRRWILPVAVLGMISVK